MKPLFHHSFSIIILFFSVALLMISIINIPTCLCEDDNQYTICNSAFTCQSSNITNLNYPFWGGNRKQFCGGITGDPNTELTCNGSVPKITIKNVKYSILEWDNTTQKLTVARDDYSSSDVCAVNNNYENSTFDDTQFRSYGDVANVTLLYGCNVATGNLQNPFYDIECGDSKYVVYTVVYSASYSAFCNPSVTVVVPILQTQAAQLGSGNAIVKDAFKDGFELKWRGNYGKCEVCVDSGGVCGNNGGTDFRCFCKDGRQKISCTLEKPSPSRMYILLLSQTNSYLCFFLELSFQQKLLIKDT